MLSCNTAYGYLYRFGCSEANSLRDIDFLVDQAHKLLVDSAFAVLPIHALVITL